MAIYLLTSFPPTNLVRIIADETGGGIVLKINNLKILKLFLIHMIA